MWTFLDFWPSKELRRRIEQLLLQNGGEITLGRAEEELQTALNNQAVCSTVFHTVFYLRSF